MGKEGEKQKVRKTYKNESEKQTEKAFLVNKKYRYLFRKLQLGSKS